MLLVLIGRSGIGKTTLAYYLRDEYGFRVQSKLPSRKVPAKDRIVVDCPTLTSNEILMTSGRRLSGHAQLLGGIVVEVTDDVSGIRVCLPNGARCVDGGRLLRTTDVLFSLMGLKKVRRQKTRKTS